MMVRRIACLLLVLALGSGCSVKFAYNNLDRFARWGVSDYLQMTPEQREYFNAEFAKLHRWHRQTQLPVYADFFESIPPAIADGADAAELLEMERTVQGWADLMLEQGLPMTAHILRSMTDQQVAELPERLAASNEEIAAPERHGDLSRAQAQWVDEVADTFKRFAGRLTPEQREYVVARSVGYIPERELWAEYRQRWQADLLTLLARRADAAAFDERFYAMARNRERYYGTELAGVFAHNEDLSRDVARWLLNHLSADQRRRFDERLTELAADFRDLAAQPDEVL